MHENAADDVCRYHTNSFLSEFHKTFFGRVRLKLEFSAVGLFRVSLSLQPPHFATLRCGGRFAPLPSLTQQSQLVIRGFASLSLSGLTRQFPFLYFFLHLSEFYGDIFAV